MASKYTCRQCLVQIRGGIKSRPLPATTIRVEPRRWHSIASKPAARTAAPAAALKRAASTAPGLAASTPGNHVAPNGLFNSFSKSPSPEIRRRAAFMKQHAYCPHPAHRQTRVPLNPNDPEARKMTGAAAQAPAHVKFECPDCGIPTYCCEEHWMDDYEAHLEICDSLKQINEDDHDLHSARTFDEFEYPSGQMEELLVNMTNWDTFLYTREFKAVNDMRSMRQVTRMLTYPVTIGSVLHELSPYNIRKGGRLTTEGLKSLSGMFWYCHLFLPRLTNDLKSPPVQPPSTSHRRRHGHQRPPSRATANAHLRSRSPRRIFPAS
jgi:splicing suppressor protein 51